jgi:signal-transduction protein with cAMP-binding, CBS, and nucleotidyltransferase domain
MIVKEVMRIAQPLDEKATLRDAVEAIAESGCEAVPVVRNHRGDPTVLQLVTVRDLPKLRRLAESAARGHAVGRTLLELLDAAGRRAGNFPTIGPEATLGDAWGIMSEECISHLPVIQHGHVIGMVSLTVTWNEFPHRSPAAGFWP